MMQIVIVVLLIVSECTAQHDWDWKRAKSNEISECRPLKEVLRFGGCYSNQFLCHDKDRFSESLLSPSEMSYDVFMSTGCFCDADCWKFKDCCVDVEPIVDSTFEDDINWKCELLPGSSVHIYVIASCPPDWNNPKELELCERRVADDEYNYLLDIPVFSNRTRQAYSNIYCAKCNQDDHLSSFRVVLTCPSWVNCQDILQHAYYMFGEHKWLVYAKGKYFGKYIYLRVSEFEEWESLKKNYIIRRCRPIVESCSNNNQVEYVENCTSYYTSYIQNAGLAGLVYKNIYCALCNNVRLAWFIECFKGKELIKLPQLYPSNYIGLPNCTIAELPISIAAAMPILPYSLLFDFHDPLGTNEVGLALRCKEGEIFDEIYSSCIPFTCGKQFIKEGSKCVANDSNDPQPKVVIHQNCYMSPIKKEEVTVLQANKTIYINKTGLTYESGDFEEYDNETYLVCHPSDLYAEKFSAIQSQLSQATMIVSLTCLAFHVAIHASIAKLRNLPGKNLICLSISLFSAQALFLFGSGNAVEYLELCIMIAILTHFCFLGSFFWMNIMAFDIYRTFARAYSLSKASHPNKTFCRYAAYAWLTPLVLVLMALVTDYTDILPGIRPGYGVRICWLNHRHGLLVFFAIPLAFLLFANISFFLLTACEIHRTTKISRSVVQRKKDQVRFFLYVKLALIMGLTWVIGYVAAVVDYDPLWYVFIVVNASQGVFIFIAFSLKKKIMNLIVKCIKGEPTEAVSGSRSVSKSTKSTTPCTQSSSEQDRLPSVV